MVEIQLLLDLYSDCGSENTECRSSYCVKIRFLPLSLSPGLWLTS